MRNLVRDYLRYPLEAVGAVLGYALFGVLPTDAASAVGGWIGRTVGPRLAIHRRALRHIGLALPETTPPRREEIARMLAGQILALFRHALVNLLVDFFFDEARAQLRLDGNAVVAPAHPDKAHG